MKRCHKSDAGLSTLTLLALTGCLTLHLSSSPLAVGQEKQSESSDAALERTRKTVRMLDEVQEDGPWLTAPPPRGDELEDGQADHRPPDPPTGDPPPEAVHGPEPSQDPTAPRGVHRSTRTPASERAAANMRFTSGAFRRRKASKRCWRRGKNSRRKSG